MVEKVQTIVKAMAGQMLSVKAMAGQMLSVKAMAGQMRAHGLCSPWNSLGQNTGVGSLSLL